MQKLRTAAGYLMVLVVLGATIASGESNEAVRVSDAGSGDQATEAFVVGDLIALGQWQVKVHGFVDPYDSGDDFLSPDAGNRWVAIDVEVFNVGTEPHDVTSIFCLDLQDDANRNFDQEIFSGSTVAAPNGEVVPGASRRGTVVYEVPAAAAGLRLNFKCQLFSSGTATVQLS